MEQQPAIIAEGDRTSPADFDVDKAPVMLKEGEIEKAGDNVPQVATSGTAENVDRATDGAEFNQKNHILGKFDSVEMLENAYKALQAEFTRKSQELANLKRLSKGEGATPTSAVESFVEFCKTNNLDDDIKNSVAQKFLDDATLKDDKFGLTQAVFRALSDKIQADERNLQSDEWVLELINSRENIKQKIIDDYINSCTNGSVPPMIINTYGSNLVASTPSAPTTLKEVADIMNKWLN